MKKIIFLAIFSIFGAGFMHSQNWKLGVSLNPEITSISWRYPNLILPDDGNYSRFPLPGFGAGIDLVKKMKGRLSFITGFHFCFLRYGEKYNSLTRNLMEKFGLGAFRIPVGIRFETPKGFYAVLAAQISPSLFLTEYVKNVIDDSVWTNHIVPYHQFILNPGFHSEIGYRFSVAEKTIFIGPNFDLIFKSNHFRIWSAGIKASLFFGKE